MACGFCAVALFLCLWHFLYLPRWPSAFTCIESRSYAALIWLFSSLDTLPHTIPDGAQVQEIRDAIQEQQALIDESRRALAQTAALDTTDAAPSAPSAQLDELQKAADDAERRANMAEIRALELQEQLKARNAELAALFGEEPAVSDDEDSNSNSSASAGSAEAGSTVISRSTVQPLDTPFAPPQAPAADSSGAASIQTAAGNGAAPSRSGASDDGGSGAPTMAPPPAAAAAAEEVNAHRGGGAGMTQWAAKLMSSWSQAAASPLSAGAHRIACVEVWWCLVMIVWYNL